jgi:hypothetical protein
MTTDVEIRVLRNRIYSGPGVYIYETHIGFLRGFGVTVGRRRDHRVWGEWSFSVQMPWPAPLPGSQVTVLERLLALARAEAEWMTDKAWRADSTALPPERTG